MVQVFFNVLIYLVLYVCKTNIFGFLRFVFYWQNNWFVMKMKICIFCSSWLAFILEANISNSHYLKSVFSLLYMWTYSLKIDPVGLSSNTDCFHPYGFEHTLRSQNQLNSKIWAKCRFPNYSFYWKEHCSCFLIAFSQINRMLLGH